MRILRITALPRAGKRRDFFYEARLRPILLDGFRRPRLLRRFNTAHLDWALVLPSLLIAFFYTLGISRSADEGDRLPPQRAASAEVAPIQAAIPEPAPAPTPAPPLEASVAPEPGRAEAASSAESAPNGLDRPALLALIRSDLPPAAASSSDDRRGLAFSPTAPSAPREPGAPTRPEPKLTRAPGFEALHGTWATNAAACPKRPASELLPLTISADGAQAGETSCAFERKTRDGAQWKIEARCTSPGSRWTANIRLLRSGNRLTWASERGRRTYLRCA